MAKVKVVITGLKKIDRKLAQLPYKIQGKVVRPAMRAGLRIVEKGTKDEVPVDTGLTKRNVKTRVPGKKKRGTIELEVRVLADGGLKKTSKAGTVFYPAIVQYGSSKMKANPFMSRAYRKYGDRARQKTIAELKAGVDREIKTL